DKLVTGVQTCALPIYRSARDCDGSPQSALVRENNGAAHQRCPELGSPSGDSLDGCHAGRDRGGVSDGVRGQIHVAMVVLGGGGRSEERRVGKEWRWWG